MNSYNRHLYSYGYVMILKWFLKNFKTGNIAHSKKMFAAYISPTLTSYERISIYAIFLKAGFVVWIINI